MSVPSLSLAPRATVSDSEDPRPGRCIRPGRPVTSHPPSLARARLAVPSQILFSTGSRSAAVAAFRKRKLKIRNLGCQGLKQRTDSEGHLDKCHNLFVQAYQDPIRGSTLVRSGWGWGRRGGKCDLRRVSLEVGVWRSSS